MSFCLDDLPLSLAIYFNSRTELFQPYFYLFTLLPSPSTVIQPLYPWVDPLAPHLPLLSHSTCANIQTVYLNFHSVIPPLLLLINSTSDCIQSLCLYLWPVVLPLLPVGYFSVPCPVQVRRYGWIYLTFPCGQSLYFCLFLPNTFASTRSLSSILSIYRVSKSADFSVEQSKWLWLLLTTNELWIW